MSRAVLNLDKAQGSRKLLGVLKHHIFLGVLIALLTFVVIYSIMLSAVAPERYELAEGDIAPESIPATRDVEDKLATRERIEQAKERVPEIYTLDQTITTGIITEIQNIFMGMDAIRVLSADRLREWEEEQEEKARQEETDSSQQNQPETPENTETASDTAPEGPTASMEVEESPEPTTAPEPSPSAEPTIEELYNSEFMAKAREFLSIELSDEDLLTVITAEQRDISLLKTRLTDTLSEMLGAGIKTEELPEFRSLLREEIQSMPVANEVKLLGITIGTPQLKANMLYDPEKTQNEKQLAASQVEKVMFKKGQFIVQAGQPVTESQIALLKELGLIKDDYVDMPFYVGIGIIVLFVLGVLILYFAFFEGELVKNPPMLLMVSLVLCLVLGLCYITSFLHPYAIPAAMGGMLLTILLRPRIGIAVNMVLALLGGLMLGSQLGVVILILAGGMLGICLIKSAQQRNTLIWAGLGVSAFSIFAVSGYEMFLTGEWLNALYTSLWTIVGGMLAAVLTIGTLPIWENLFNVITPLKLVELSNPNNPILKRLLMETPGTYHHSIVVANLAENGAEAIGVNGLLARVGAYYHDIGKLERPYYFKENQLYTDNPHDRLDPITSTRIITTHTLDGIELAKRYKVPRLIQDFILQHHGTTPVVYFYHKAKSQDSEKDYKLDNFRYTGPKPSSPESAIVMIADTVEAAVRALPEPTLDKVEALIRKLIKEKADDGQLDDCSLTFRDLDRMAKAFTNAISGIFHERVRYPDVKLKEEREQS
jgi:putative nucleotidyltransferase with HDIG domain